MKTMSANEAKKHFGELLDTARREPVVVEKHGRRVAVMVSAEDYDDFQLAKLDRLRFEVDKGLDDVRSGRTISVNTPEEKKEFLDNIKREATKRLKKRA